MNVFDFTPTTFIIDLNSEYFKQQIEQFVKFFMASLKYTEKTKE